MSPCCVSGAQRTTRSLCPVLSVWETQRRVWRAGYWEDTEEGSPKAAPPGGVSPTEGDRGQEGAGCSRKRLGQGNSPEEERPGAPRGRPRGWPRDPDMTLALCPAPPPPPPGQARGAYLSRYSTRRPREEPSLKGWRGGVLRADSVSGPLSACAGGTAPDAAAGGDGSGEDVAAERREVSGGGASGLERRFRRRPGS